MKSMRGLLLPKNITGELMIDPQGEVVNIAWQTRPYRSDRVPGEIQGSLTSEPELTSLLIIHEAPQLKRDLCLC